MNRKWVYAAATLPAVAIILGQVANAAANHSPKPALPLEKTITPRGHSGADGHGILAAMNQSDVGSTNPLQIGPPVQVPKTKPVTVTILSHHLFNNAENVTSQVTLPNGKWSKVVLTVHGTQSGKQYDRLMQVWAGNTQIFTGVTPEPTASGIEWTVRKDVTDYLPILQGNIAFTSECDNYPNSVDNGIPDMSVTLSFYPEEKNQAHNQSKDTADSDASWQTVAGLAIAKHGVQNSVVPLQSGPSMTALHNTTDTFKDTVDRPHDIVGASLRLNLIPQINDEFWWGSIPSFREIEVSIDGTPAGVVWPNSYVYTGGVNPMLWRPVTGIHTMDIPAYQVDLSPFAGMLGGKHTISLTVMNNADYWLVSGSLMLTEAKGMTTSGSITTDTLSFPENSPLTNTPGYGSGNTMTSQTANRDYTINGTLSTPAGDFQAKVHQTMQFSNDQTNTSANYFGLIHGNQMVDTDSTLVGRSMQTLAWHNKTMYTLDCANGYVQDTSSSNFMLPANLTQTMQVDNELVRGDKSTYNSKLYETIQGYAELQTGSPSQTVALGSTTGYANYSDSLGQKYNRVIVARGGKVLSDEVSGNMGG